MKHNHTVAKILFGLSMFFTGASGLVNEYVLSTVSIYNIGSSIEQFSITIAVMLGMMGVGSEAQKYVSDKNLIAKFARLEVALAIIGSFAPIVIYAGYGYLENHYNLVYYIFVALIGFLVGFEIPFIIRINESFTDTLKSNLSLIMSMDYLGSFFGALIWVYLLLPHFNLNQISFIVSGTNFLVAMITLTYFVRTRVISFSYVKTSGLIALFVVFIYGFNNVVGWGEKIEQKLYNDPIVATGTSKYQHLTVTHNNMLDEVRLYINGNVQFSSLDERRYHELMVHSVMSSSKEHRNILIFGGGDGLALRELKKYKDIESITLIDLDPYMVEFSSTNKYLIDLNEGAFEDARITVLPNSVTSGEVYNVLKKDEQNKEVNIASLNVINIDADMILKKIEAYKFDVVIIDFPDPSSIELNKLYTKQFYMKLKRVFSPGAKFIVQATSPYHAKEAFLCIGRTIEAAGFNTLPLHLNIPSFGEWGWWIGSMEETETIRDKLSNIASFSVETSYLTPEIIKSSMVFGKGELVAQKDVVNELMFPALLDIYNKNSWLFY